MTTTILYVCVTCRGNPATADDAPRSGARLLAAVEQRLIADGDKGIAVVPANCLSNCPRGCSAAVSASGKWTYVIGDLDPDRHAGDVIDFARLHRAHEQGVPEWRDRPEHVRKHTIARVPPVKPAAPSPLRTIPGAVMSVAKVPCTIVTGFLGAGKTTLVRHVLENADGRRLAVIVNEFGDVGIDGEILKSCGVESCPEDAIVELANGCLCCTVADDFVPALKGLLDRPSPPEHIVIETSGLALPKPLVKAFNWPEIASRVTVDGVIAVVDGAAVAAGRFADDPEAIARQRAEDSSLDHDNPLEEVFEDQLLCADLVILNKADLMSSEQRRSVVDEIGKTLSRAVKVVETENGKVSLKVLLGLGAEAEADLASRPSHHDLEGEHDHEDFDTFIVELPVFESPQHLVDRLVKAAETHDILRMKGFVDIAGKPMRLLVQGVGARVQHQYDRKWPGERRGRLVVIGEKGFDRDAIRDLIAS